MIAAAKPRGNVGQQGQALALSSRAPLSPSYDLATGRTAVLPPCQLEAAAAAASPTLPVAVAEPQPLPLPGTGAIPTSPNSLRIMLQLLGGPTVQSPERRAPAVCNLASRFKHVEGRRRKDQTESWRARLRRNGTLLCLGKGFATEMEAVICVQQFLLAELEQVNRELQYTHHLPHTHTSAASVSISTDPCTQEEALDKPARTNGDVQP